MNSWPSRTATCLAGLTLVCVCSGSLSAQDPTNRELFAGTVDETIRDILTRFGSAYDPAERVIALEVDVAVSLDANLYGTRAFCGPNGQRSVTVSEVFARSLFMSVDAAAIERTWGPTGFGWDYVEEVAEVVHGNMLAYERGSPLSPLPTPYVGLSDREFRLLDDDPELSMLRGGVYFQSLGFVLAHEIGHHVLGHIDPPSRCDRSRDLATSRSQEADADRWATRLMIDAELSPLSALPSLLLLYGLDREAIRTETARRHPAEVRRIQDVLTSTRDVLRDGLRERGVPAAEIARVEEQIEEILVGITRELGDAMLPAPGGSEFGSALETLIREARRDFDAVRGRRLRSGRIYTYYETTVGLPGFQDCRIASRAGNRPTLSCEGGYGFEELVRTVNAVLGSYSDYFEGAYVWDEGSVQVWVDSDDGIVALQIAP